MLLNEGMGVSIQRAFFLFKSAAFAKHLSVHYSILVLVNHLKLGKLNTCHNIGKKSLKHSGQSGFCVYSMLEKEMIICKFTLSLTVFEIMGYKVMHENRIFYFNLILGGRISKWIRLGTCYHEVYTAVCLILTSVQVFTHPNPGVSLISQPGISGFPPHQGWPPCNKLTFAKWL